VAPIDTSAHTNRWRKKSLSEKALLAIGMLLVAIIVPSWKADLLVAATMILATLAGARVSFSLWWKTMTAPIGFLIVGVASVVFEVSDWRVGIAPNGLALAVRLAGHAFAGVTCLLFLALTTPAADITAGLRRLGVPAEIVEMMLLIYRFVFQLLDTAQTMHAAQAARLGYSSRRRHMHSLGILIASLMPRALARAEALEVGLAARGWHGDLKVLSPVRPASLWWLGGIGLLELIILVYGLRFA
jgi:cobalt/nickel transport system permease protein